MSLLKRFNPYTLSDEVVDALATGRGEVLHDALAEIEANRTRRPAQHILLVAPRGFGKSFFLRMVQNALRDRPGIGFALLPEEQPNIVRPALFLSEIRRVLEGRTAAEVGVRRDLGPRAWEDACTALRAAIDERLGPDGLLVVGVENFDDLLRDVFADPAAGQQLRGLLTREDGRLMLLGTSTTAVDGDPAAPLYQAYAPFELRRWGEEDCLGFFDRIREREGRPLLEGAARARARAIAIFAGGSPRIATVLYEVLESRDAESAAAALDALVDELSDYYRARLKALSPRARAVLDTLLRQGEPRSQSEIAALMGASQADIAEPFRELLTSETLSGGASERPGARDSVYQVTDRLFAHFYRLRYFDPEGRQPRLERIADFLAGFFTAEEKQAEAEKLRSAGRMAEAAVYERLLAGPKHLVLPGGETPAARVAASEARLAAARRRGDREAELAALFDLGDALGDAARHTAAIETLRDALAMLGADGDPRRTLRALRWIGWSQGRMGEPAAAISTLREALSRAEAAGNRREQAAALRLLGWSQGQMGEHAAAIATLREALARAEALGARREQAAVLRLTGLSQGAMGEHAAAIATLHDAQARAEAAGDLLKQAEALCAIGWNQGQMGEHAAATATLREALARAEAAGDRREQAEASRFLLLFASRGGLGLPDAVDRLATLLGHKAEDENESEWPALYLDHALSLALPAGQGAAIGQLVLAHADRFTDLFMANRAAGAAAGRIMALVASQGRAAAYGAIAPLLQVLASSDPLAAPPPLLPHLAMALAEQAKDPPLLRDIADLLDRLAPQILATEIALLRARAIDLEHPDDPAALERSDPDIAAAIRRLRGTQEPEALFRRGKPKAAPKRRKKGG
ncbi:tetratricopeptide repeat protein [Falsiroseomonas stagni]|uniref:Tetratricopeptide repeat-containing protein n=1 Tax=Falsiroseomonas stagni DSM 19981 TaxID=1123062 RepID=A0A1I4DRH0_9PROT|nr:tetratricopeptide repeat protein [Falsiroseomonas stagni]SFK95549.1 Tetratricopeptide repeat-containing protein [Falsiroseomonas stagni DSM 19981]